MLQSSEISIKNLTTALSAQLPNEVLAWLEAALDEISSSERNETTARETHTYLSAIARRKSGSALLLGLPGDNNHWQVDEAIRILLLTKLLEVSVTGTTKTLVEEAYHLGDEYEKISIIRGLYLLDNKGELIDLAILTGRTNNVNLFAAIALANSYPASNYDDRAFDQLVLKALFMDLDISYIVGLQPRLTPKLTSLCFDLVKERLAADRDPPNSIWLAIKFSDLSTADQDIYLRFTIEEPKHRYYSLRSLSQHSSVNYPSSFWQQLEKLLTIETKENTKEIIVAMLNKHNT